MKKDKTKSIIAIVIVMAMALPAMSHLMTGSTDAALTDPGDVTVTMYDVGGAGGFGEPQYFTELDGKLYFAAKNEVVGQNNAELMVYDPVTDQVTNVVDLNPGSDGAFVMLLTVHMGKLYFAAMAADYDEELYVYDPVTDQTDKIDVNPTGGSQPRDLFSASNGMLYFRGLLSNYDNELHEYNPSNGAINIYQFGIGTDPWGNPNQGSPKMQCEYNGWMYGSAKDAEGTEFHRFNLNTKSHNRLTNINPGYGASGDGRNSYPVDAMVFNNEIFFNAQSDGITNAELWIYTPSTGGLRVVEIDTGTTPEGSQAGGNPRYFTEYNGYLYFSAQIIPEGNELRRYNPAIDDVELVLDSYPGQWWFDVFGPGMWFGNDGFTQDIVLLNDKFYYTANFDNREIWEYDPVTDQGQLLVELFPGDDQWGNTNHGDPIYTTVFDGKIFFRGSSAAAHQELFSVEIGGSPPVNNPPNTPSTPSGPTSGDTGVSYSYSTSATDPDGDTVRYGWDWNGDSVVDEWTGYQSSGSQNSRSHTWNTDGTYQVRVRADDGTAMSSWSNVRTVTITSPNSGPANPSTPSGPTSGLTGTSYTYSTSTTDPDGDTVRYGWDWDGDNNVDEWTGYSGSGVTINTAHTWTSAGTYNVKVGAQDDQGTYSSWSGVRTVTIAAPNSAPNTPSIPSGPTSGETDVSYSYSTSTTDPDGDTVRYGWDWNGDGTVDEWTGYQSSGSQNSRSHTFTSAGTYNVQVRADDGEDMSGWSNDRIVNIINLGTITVTGPNGGESWQRGTTHAITWSTTPTVGSNVKIELYKGGSYYSTISSSTNNDGSYNWAIPAGQTAGSDYRVRITDLTYASIWDQSNGDFEVYALGSITVTDPNGGESWAQGTSHAVTWSDSGVTGSTVKIELYKGGSYLSTITSSTNNDGSYNWAIPGAQAEGTDYTVRITDLTYATIYDTSNGNFEVYEPNVAPGTPSTPSGPTSGFIDISYSYSTSATDGNGDTIRYGWDWNGDSVVDQWTGYISSGATANTAHTWTSAGTYNVKVRADDGTAMSSWSGVRTVTIDVPDYPPATPSIPAGPTSGEIDIEYDYTTSATDANGDTIRYGWDWDGDFTVDDWTGYLASGATATGSHTWTSAGTYQVRVRAQANGVLSSWSAARSVNIGVPDYPPTTPSIPAGPTTGFIDTEYDYTTSATDDNGDTIRYGWDWDGDFTVDDWTGYLASGATATGSHTWTSAGTYQVRVRAQANGVLSSWSPVRTVVISVPDYPPTTPSTPAGPTSGEIDIEYDYTTSATDGNGDTIRYGWDWNGDFTVDDWTGYLASGATATGSHTWTSEGTYQVHVRAQANGVLSSWSVARSVNIGVPDYPPITPSTPAGQTTGFIDTEYDYTTSSTDANGDTIRYGWDWNGDFTVDEWSGYLASGATATGSHTWGSPDTYEVRVKAEANGVQSSWSTAKTVIINIPEYPPTTPSTPAGPSSGEPGVSYDYTTSATDANGDQIRYGWDWNGDSTVDEWTGYYASGAVATTSHTWASAGTYSVKVMAEANSVQSGWSGVKVVTISVPGGNAPATPATPSGPTTGVIAASYDYSTSTTDPNGDDVRYGWDWDGDQVVDEWTSSYTSGAVASTSHIWATAGTYDVSVMAEDLVGGGSVTNEFYSDMDDHPSNSILNVAEAFGAPDGVGAIANAGGDQLFARSSTIGSNSGAITQVEFAVTHRNVGGSGQSWLGYLTNGGLGATYTSFTPGTSWQTTYLDVTADRAWTWADLQNTEFYVPRGSSGGEHQYDAVFFRITYDAPAASEQSGWSNALTVTIDDPVGFADEDLDQDGMVGFSDLAILIGAWGPNAGHPADFDDSGFVNNDDLDMMLLAWTAEPIEITTWESGYNVAGYLVNSGEAFFCDDTGETILGKNPSYDEAVPTDTISDGSIVTGGHTSGGTELYEGWVWTPTGGLEALRDYLVAAGYDDAATWDYTYYATTVSEDGMLWLIEPGAFWVDLTATASNSGLDRLDFDGDGDVDADDWFTGDSAQYNGIYPAIYFHVNNPALLAQHYPWITDPDAQLDHDGDGIATMGEIYAGNPSVNNLDSYYTEWYVYTNYATYYTYYYPD